MIAPDISHASAPARAGVNRSCLGGDRVVLGPVLPDDLGALFTWLNDVQVAHLDLPYRPVDCLAFRDWLARLSKDNSQILFAIRKHQSAPIIGFVLFKNFQPVFQCAELGARIGVESERGKGFGTEAVRLALDYGWSVLNLHRVGLQVLAHNQRAIASYKRAGFAVEGCLREAAFIDGQWRDLVLMGALAPKPARCDRRKLPS